jgi:hypothetical protein
MKAYEYKLVHLNRTHLRDDGSAELARLNEEGASGWHVIAVRDDPREGSNLVFFLERETER